MRIEITLKIIPDGSEALTVSVPVVHQEAPPLSTRKSAAPVDWFDEQTPRRQRERRRKEAQAHENH
jgi:hypothetical protein